MSRLETKNYNILLTEKLPIYQPYHKAKLISMNILLVTKYCHLQQQIIEQAKFTYSPLRKGFEKQIKTIQDQGQKQVEALKDLKTKEQIKAIEGKFNNQSRAAIIFNDLISKRKSIMNDLYEIVDKNKLKFEYIGNTKDVSFYEYMDSKELFDKIKNKQLKFDDTTKKREKLLNKINKVKVSRKSHE